MSAIPQTMKALITQADKTAKIEEIPVPEIDDTEVLIKVTALAQNPTDWQYVEYITHAGTITGVDFTGNVVKVGKDVTDVVVGDRVTGFVHGGTYKDRGAFAEYVKTGGDLVWKVPDNITDEEAATLGCAFWTAAQGLFHPNRLGLVEPPAKADFSEWILVYAGSTSVGLYAVQLAHLAGYKVVATASPKNFDVVKAHGADLVFDYKDPEVVSKIKEATGDSLHRGFDAISNLDSQTIAIKSMASGPGKIITIQLAKPDAQKINPENILQHMLIYTALGREFALSKKYPVSESDRAHIVQLLKKVPGWVAEGKVKPNPTKFWPGGLEAVPEGLQYMKEGKVSGEKIVYRL